MNLENLKKRLFSFIEDDLNIGECWEFQGAKAKGYGKIKVNGNDMGAHRVSYWVHNNEKPPSDLFVCHHCDNPPCINPNHLFLGTHSDNMKDAYRKGRLIVPKGDRFEDGHLPENSEMSLEKAKIVKKHIMNEDREISLKELASKYGIKYQTARDISAGRSYINL